MIESVNRAGGVNGAAQALMLAAMMHMMQGPGSSSGNQGSGSPIQTMLNLLSEMLKLAAQALKPQGEGEGQGGPQGSGGAQGPGCAQQADGVGGSSGEQMAQTIMQLMQEIMKIMQKLMGGQQDENDSPFQATPQAGQAADILSSLADILKGASDILSGASDLLGGGQGTPGGSHGGSPFAPPAGGWNGKPNGTPNGAPGGSPHSTPGGDSVGGGKPVDSTGNPPITTGGNAKVGDAPAGMPQDKWQLCVEAGKQTGQDPYVLAAMMEKESQYGNALYGDSAGDGLMQVEPGTRQAYAGKFRQVTGREYNHGSELDQVTMAGVILGDKGGDTATNLRKYNGGDNWYPGATDSYGRVIRADEYASSVASRANELRLSSGG